MILNRIYLSISIFLFFVIKTFCQEKKDIPNDSIFKEQLKEVVVIGKNNVMSLSKKLFTVGVISKEDLKKVAANNLADVLTQNLNLTITPDPSTGRSTVSMFGLDGEYVKILLDGIPVVNDNGAGNNIDITQLNLENIIRIEVVEGSMGVLYGDNAVAGVINIVNNRRVKNDWEIQASIQEETIGKEYNLKDEGRHIQNLKLSKKINNNFNVTAGVSRNNFNGFYNIYKGPDYVKIEDDAVVNDTLRGTEWNPKKQLTFFGNTNIHIGKHTIFYKVQHFNETVNVYNRIITGTAKNLSGNLNPTTPDKQYDTKKLVNNIVFNGPLLGETEYNVFFSIQNQERYFLHYTYNIFEKGIQSIIEDRKDQSSNYTFTKGFVNNIIPKSSFANLQLGYEFNWQKGYDAIASGDNSDHIIENQLNNYDFFGVLDVNLNDKFSIYPGARLTNNSQFGNKGIWSLSSKYKFNDDFNLKAILGSAFKIPNFSQLFFYFVDANHNVQGNPHLNPEDGISIFLTFDKKTKISENSKLKTILKGYHFNINDKIESIVTVDENNTNLFTFDNIDNHKIWGIQFQNTFTHKNLSISLGTTYMGEALTVLEDDITDPEFLWSVNLNSNINYNIPTIKTSLSGQIKYTGKTQILLDDGNIGVTNGFTWFDASIRKELTKNIDVTFGARNILDIVNVNATDVAAEGHDANAATSRVFGNGRSYFLKILFNLNFNSKP